MFSGYRSALTLPGALRFSSAGLLARLPNSIETLGIVLFVSNQTGSYARAGALSAAYQVSVAAGAPLTSRLADRRGQTAVLTTLCIANAALIVTFVALILTEAPLAAAFVMAALAGATQPAVGAMVRARWAKLSPDTQTLRTAFALESILDEAVFTVGPLITAVLAFRIGLPAPLILAAVLVLVGGLMLAAQRSTAPDPVARRHDQERGVLGYPALFVVVAAAVGIGGVFGTYEVAAVAFAQNDGQAGMSGVILGLWAFGSLLGGLVYGSRHWPGTLPRQALVLTAALTVAITPAVFVRSVWVLAVAATVAGIMVAPALIAAFALTERLVPHRLLTESLTWATSGLGVGFAAGTAAAGVVVDHAGTTAAFGLGIAAAVTATSLFAIGQRYLLRSVRTQGPLPPAVARVDDPIPGPTPGAAGID